LVIGELLFLKIANHKSSITNNKYYFLLRRTKWQRIRKRLFFVTLETGGSSPGGKRRASRETPGRRNECRPEIQSSNPQVVVIEGSLLSQANSIRRIVNWPASSARRSGPTRPKPREPANDKCFVLQSKLEKQKIIDYW
jgi:hypothetical protein